MHVTTQRNHQRTQAQVFLVPVERRRAAGPRNRIGVQSLAELGSITVRISHVSQTGASRKPKEPKQAERRAPREHRPIGYVEHEQNNSVLKNKRKKKQKEKRRKECVFEVRSLRRRNKKKFLVQGCLTSGRTNLCLQIKSKFLSLTWLGMSHFSPQGFLSSGLSHFGVKIWDGKK